MGLSGRKIKQRIPADPRNLAWADDAAKFGSSYLSKFGWDSSKGLGASGDGRTTHVKVSQKLDMLGIGAAHRSDPDGIAWKQNKDFENLLKRLNEAGTVDGDDTGLKVEDDGEAAPNKDGNDGAGKKRRRKESLDTMAEKSTKKKRRKNREDKQSKEVTMATNSANTAETDDSCPVSKAIVTSAYIPRHRAHRARAIASKNLASKSTTAISEILGIVPTSSSSSMASGSGTPSDKLASPGNELTIGSLTTSTKSVADYFRDKLFFKSSAKTGTAPVALRPEREAEAHDAPRSGLGSSRLNPDMSKLSISSVPAPQETFISQPASMTISIECQEQTASKDISLENTSSTTKTKGKGEKMRTDAIHPDSESSVGQTSGGQKHTKSDKKTRKVKKRSRDNDGNC